MAAPTEADRLKNGYYNSDNVSASNPGGLSNNGHEVNFPAALADVGTVATWLGTEADATIATVTALELSARNLAGSAISGTSSTSLTVATGAKTLTTQAGKAFVPGHAVQLVDTANVANTMSGTVTTYNSANGGMTVNVTKTTGSGTVASWAVRVFVDIPPIEMRRFAKSASYTVVAADRAQVIECSGTFTLGFAAAATLGDGFYCYISNTGTGDVTLDPNGAELLDGIAGFIMYPGEMRLVQCDGTALRSFVLVAFSKTFTASGNFTKPPGYTRFAGMLWGAGGGGGKNNTGIYQCGGGGGGACHPFSLASADVAASQSFTIGAGGAGATTAAVAAGTGGASTFGGVVAWGGGGGFGSSSASTSGASGGGVLSQGQGAGSDIPVIGGQPALIISAVGNNAVPGIGYGGASSCAASVWGGAGGGGSLQGAATHGGASVYGGGGGGGAGSANTNGGVSVFGGNGGLGFNGSNGGFGTVPGGGGGATQTGTMGGPGARGELRIWGIV